MAVTVSVKIDIDAPIANVWQILTDFNRYAEWNPFLPKVETSKVVGEPTLLHVKWIGAKKSFLQPEILSAFEENKKVCWGMEWKPSFLLKANRCQTLESLSDSRTIYRSEETFSGIFVPLVLLLYKKKILAGFTATALALKKRAEK